MAIFEGTREEDTEETTVGDLEETGEEEGTTSMGIVLIIKDHRINLTTTTTGHHPPHPSRIDSPKFDASPLP